MVVVTQAGLVNHHRLAKVGDEKLVVIDIAFSAWIGGAKTIHLASHGRAPLPPERPAAFLGARRE
jgi:hypothetical protein